MHNSIPATVALSDGTLLLLLNYNAFIFITGNRIWAQQWIRRLSVQDVRKYSNELHKSYIQGAIFLRIKGLSFNSKTPICRTEILKHPLAKHTIYP